MSYAHDPRQNYLLAALPADEYAAELFPQLERIAMPLGMVLHEPGRPPTYAYFPTTSIASLNYLTENGESVDVAVIGNEGIASIALFLGGGSTVNKAVVRSAGYGYRLRGQVLKEAFGHGGPIQGLLLRYTQALLTQIAQTAVCNRRHTLDQQFCRWLLLCLDRLPFNRLGMTQQLIADMLGMRREGVSVVAG